MNKIYFIFALLFFLTSVPARSQESYLCVSEASGGVAYDSSQKKWKGTKFSNPNDKIIISKKNGKWKMKDFGSKFEDDCGELTKSGSLGCSNVFGDLIFNLNTKRYMKSYFIGYIDGKDNIENTPSITIGTCSLI